MLTKPTILALAALLVCSACADKNPIKRADVSSHQQFSSIRWDEAVAARSAAKVNNTSMIMMR